MNETLMNLLAAVITAAIPVLFTALILFINRLKEKVLAQIDSIKQQSYLTEITDAVTAAVSATSQTYVDSLKQHGTFTAAAQKEAAQKALDACLAAISPAAQAFISTAYGDLVMYLSNRIEAEVRNQKLYVGTAINQIGSSTDL